MEEFRIVLADACKIVKESSRKRVILGADEDGRVMVEFSEPVGGRRVKMLTPDEINGMLYKEETSESPANAEEAMAEETEPPTAGQEESGESALERIPKDAQTGEPQYTQTDADTAWDAIVEQTEGDKGMARYVAESMMKAKEEALKKLESSEPKAGATVTETIAAAKEHKAAIAAARQELEQWKAIAEVENRRTAEEKVVSSLPAVGNDTVEVQSQSEVGNSMSGNSSEATSSTDKVSESSKTKQGKDAETDVKLSDEIDENGKPLVLAKDGTTTFGIMEPESGLREAPIQLSLGENYVGEDGKNHGYGLLHIEAGHGKQIRSAGFPSVEEFVEEVAKNYVDIREGAKIGNTQTYLLEMTDDHNNTLFVQLSKDGTYWNVNSAGIFNVKYSRRKPKVYSVPALGEDINTDTSEVDSDHSEGVAAPAGNSSKTSASKVSESPETKQEKAEKSISARVKEATADVNTQPAEAQKEAGNYKKGHVQVGAFDITIEQPEGSIRRGTDADGKQWESKMHNTYGYFRGTEGVDGDHIDVFLSNDIDGWNGRKVFVVDQYNPDGTFDEHKVMLGFNDASDAKNNYLANYEKGWANGRRIDVSAVNLEDFEKWIAGSHRKTKPFSEYKSVKSVDDSETFKGHKVENSGKEALEDVIGRSLNADETHRLIAFMENTAESAPELELTPQNWAKEFGESGVVSTPIGEVKQGDNQYLKLAQQGRNGKLGMIKPTLEHPSVIIEDERASRDGNTERGTSYVFIKTFVKKDGSRYYHFASITVSKEGKEVVISSQERSTNRISKLLQQGKVTWIDREFSLHPTAQIEKSVPLNDSNKPTSTDSQPALLGINSSELNASEGAQKRTTSTGKVSESPETKQEKAENSISAKVKEAKSKSAPDVKRQQTRQSQNEPQNIEVQIKHLEEIKDYPGADKKIVQSEIDRLKAKEEAKAKSKSEEAKSKSKEENGVDDAKIDAVLEALDKGEEKAARRLASKLTNKELSKARSKAKPSFLLEYEWQWRAQNRGDVSLHDWMLENQYVEPVKRVSGTFRITDYTAPKDSPYAERLGGVFHDKSGFAVATDGRILVADKDDFDPKLKGKVIGKDGAAMGNEFLNWQKTIPTAKETKSSRIDVEDLHRFVAGVLKADKHAYISLRLPDGTAVSFRADKLNLMLRAMKRLGADRLLYAKDGTRLVAKSDKGVALLIWRVSAEDESMEEYGYAYPGNTVSYHRGEVVSEMSPGERVLRDAVIDRLRESGMEVITDEGTGQRVLDEANGKAKLSAKKRRALETASLGKTPRSLTVVSSADGANVLKSIDTLVSEFEKSAVQPKTFIGDVAKALGAKRGGSASEYASFETKNGKIITIRLSNHNAKVSNFDANGETDGISIVVSPKKSEGMTNDGKAHVVEYYYDAIKLRRAEGKPLADIVRSIKQALYSGEFEDTTGLAERQEVNAEITDRVRFFRTAKGEAYGFTVGGKIYIDPKIANTETPIHEYAHLWAAALRGQNPKEWQNIVELMKGTSVWDEVKKRYPELNTDDDIADEVLATYSGRRGAERLREDQRKIAGDKGGVFEKAEAISALERVKQALRKFWKSVADFLHIHYKSAEEVADRVMKDLLDGVDPGKHFNSRNDDPRFMFAGKKGAARADRGEEALTRQNNLDAAQKMEAAKKEAKAIKLATGWERGADGKWRYEIPDGIYHPKGDAELKKVLAKQPWREELNGLSDRILDGEGLSKEETERFNELSEKEAAFKADYLKKEKPHLADWLENDELFKAYPELKRVGIVFTDNMPKEQAGYYDSKSNTITVNTNSSEDPASIIAHEVQHAIQRYEGFATGGNLKAAMEYLSGNKRADVKIKRQLAYKLSQEKGLGLSEEEVNSLIGHLEYEDISDDELQKQIDALCQKHNITEDQLEDIYPMDSVWHEAYNRISGEAEARNVQKRMGMTAEERRASLAADTEDVARDSQILLFDDTGKNMSLESPKEDDINAKFNIRLAELVKNPDQKDKVLHLGRSSKFLTDGGLADAEIILEFDKLAHKSKEGYKHEHPFDISDIKDLPKAISSPNAVFDNTNGKNDGRVILTELKKDGRNFIVAVKTSAQNRRGGIVLEVNQITTLFPKDAKGIVYWLNSGKATNIDREKALRFIEALPNHPGTTIKEEELFSAAKVVKDFVNPKFESENDALFRGGKELRDGRKIEFVRKPTATYNALARHLQAEGIKPDMHEARTGSRYMSFEKDGVQWEVRSSDHTKPEYYGEAQKPVELTYYKDKQGEENLSVSVDLGTSGYNIEDMKALMAEIDRLKNDAGEVKESFDKSVVSDEAAKRYPLLSQAFGVKSDNEVRAKEEAREHAEEARKQEMRSAVEDMAGKLHLNNVDIVDKPAGRGAGRRERAKGMFERSTGRITINTGNCADKRDAVVTLLHEAVAHHGLRKLFGENFETFLDNVYNSANAEIRRIIDKHSSRYGGDKRTATEEYMASLAERTDFENAKKSGWWQRIKDFFLKMLEKIGLKGFKGEDLSDNELRYVLWRSYENLKSGGKDTVFSAADDLAKQSELKVGEFAPDAKAEGSVAALNTRFNNELQQQIDGNLPSNHIYQMGNPGKILRSTGVPDLPIQMNAKRLQDKATLFDHNFELYEVKDLVKALQNPLAVFSYGDKTKAQNIIVPLQKDGKNFIVGLSLNPTVGGKALEINSIRNVFPKDNSEWLNWISQGKALYLDKEKIQTLIAQQRTNLADVEYLDLDPAAKVVENFENPKFESENDALFRDGDAKDYEKAQARETYERRVSTGMFQSREAIQDSMLSLKVAMDEIEEATAGKAKRIEDYDGFENAYLGENRLSSVNQAESAAFAHLLIRPMMEEVNRLAPTAEDRAELIDYMFAKHGLERNAYMRQQAAEKKLAEYKKQNPGTAKTAADFIDAERDYAGLTTLTGEADVSAAEAEAQRMVADYENDYTFHGTWNEIYVCRKKIC